VIQLRAVRADDAEALYPLIAGTAVTDTILWDGPTSPAEYRQAIAERAAQVARGEIHFFTILDGERPVGTIDVRPSSEFRGDLGLWLGAAYHKRGFGTEAVRLATSYAFDRLGLAKLEATVFVGNLASRRIFEKNGFRLEGTIRCAVKKRGKLVDEWLLGITREEHAAAS
jgi:RimJ/RimL family protein N-acetyltransferase